MIIHGQPVNNEILTIQKSIADNLQNKHLFSSTKEDTASNSIELQPPISMRDCLFVFKNSSHVAKSCRILASDIIYNEITLTHSDEEADDHQVNQVQKINEYLLNNIDELYNLAVDYYYSGWAAMEYAWGNTKFTLQQIPIHSCAVVKVRDQGEEFYLLRQKINSITRYFKIMGEDYPDTLQFFSGEKLGYASLIGGDNIYQFFSLPKWIQN